MKYLILITLVTLTSYLPALQPQLEYSPQYFSIDLSEGGSTTETLYLTNSGDEELQYNLNFCSRGTSGGSRDISGSEIICLNHDFMPGETVTWTLVLTNNSGDEENIADVLIIFPDEVTLNWIGNFIGGSGGEIIYQEEVSESNIVFWHGTDNNGNGVLRPGESATAELGLEIDSCCYNDLVNEYSLYGDLGNMQDGTFTVTTLCIGWCSICSSQGEIAPGATEEIDITFCGLDLDPGTYESELIVSDNCRNQTIIPLELEITASANHDDELTACRHRIFNSPNPFNPTTRVCFYLTEDEEITINIYNLKGHLVRTLINRDYYSHGEHQVSWDGRDEKGNLLENGIYLCKLEASGRSISSKMCLLK